MPAERTMSSGALELNQSQFTSISELVHRVCGIHLHPGKFGLVRTRLGRVVREAGMHDIDAYLAHATRDASGREAARLVDALTTNKTSFFREPKHFDLLRKRLLAELWVRDRPLRVWSAGCSSGEEAYTLAIVLDEELGSAGAARILATDISARMLAHARRGVYGEEALRDVPAMSRVRYFSPVNGPDRAAEVGPRLRSMIRFAQLNLMDPWPMTGPFDLICCRNVMMYFDKETQQALVDRFWHMLAPGGYFFGGHSESFAALGHRFRYVQPAVYCRPA
jgi:chemotaxis protein methyltransferase CheR